MAVGVAIFVFGWGLVGVGLVLAVYIDLRIHALRQSGDLPQKTDQLMGWSVSIDFGYLYSSRLRLLDSHTRRLVPIIRVALPLGAILCVASFLLS